MDIFVADGRIVDETRPELIIDATDKTVMPGGIDVHSHVATYGMNLARFTCKFPILNEIGYTYARMGYTHVNEPLMTLNTASYVHHELSGIPIVDTSASLVLSLYDIDREIREGATESVKNLLPFLLDLTKSIGVKIYDLRVKYRKSGFFYRGISLNKCLNFFAELISTESGRTMPKIQLRTYPELLDESADVLSAFWLAHIASGIDSDNRYEGAKEILKKGGAVDLGIFCPSQQDDIPDTHMSIGYDVPDATDEKFISMDIGLEQPLIISNLSAKNQRDKKVYYSLKFALEAVEQLNTDSSCISFSTDSPNGCLFYTYPRLFAGLLSKTNRKELTNAALPEIEYSLYELAKITRTNPARLLGLKDKGHLGAGAVADIAIYDIGDYTEGRELERRLSRCSSLLKGGEMVIKGGDMINHGVCSNRTYYFEIDRTELEEAKEKQRELIERICNRTSFRAEHLKVDDCFTQPFVFAQ